MLAFHPKTGKEVRVIQTDATLWREHKTLLYIDAPLTSACGWDTVSENDCQPTFRIIIDPLSAACNPTSMKVASMKSRLLVISNAILEAIGLEEFKKIGIKNVICLEEIHQMYAHLGAAWDGTLEDACIIIAGLLHYKRVSGIWGVRAEKLNIGKETSPPNRLWWITQFYSPKDKKRRTEIRTCLSENVASKCIDKIILLNEREEDYLKNEKIEEVVIGHRLTYKDVYAQIGRMPDDVIAVFANADICIDDSTWNEVWNLNMEDKFLALLRWDVPESGLQKDATIFGPRADSQDTWIIRAIDVKRRLAASPTAFDALDFKFGHMGCDNAIALEMMRQKFLVVNPAQSIRTYHFHVSGVRGYDNLDILERPVFLYLQPSGIHDLSPNFKVEGTVVKPEVMDRRVRGQGAKKWKESVKNFSAGEYTPKKETIFHIGECFQTCDGLVFDRRKMYIGDSAKAKETWNGAKIHGMMPTLEAEKAFVVPWPLGADKSKEMYCLKYMSKVLRLWDLDGPGEFYGCEDPEFEAVLSMFNWEQETLPIVAREKDALLWAKNGVGFCIKDKEEDVVLAEDVAALRKYMKGWEPAVTQDSKTIVIMEDGILLTAEIVRELEKALEEAEFVVKVVYPRKTSLQRLLSVTSGAWGMVCAGGISSNGWNWMLPVGSHVFEVNSTKTLGIEISSAAKLNHYFVNITDSASPHSLVLEEVMKVLFTSASPFDTKPTVFVPMEKEGLFSHPGDSFREMLRLWNVAGYINLQEHPTAAMVWWGEVGANGVLLYDRPTNEWRLSAPLEEREWKFALFGNPAIASTADASKESPWFFWPRRPELVEALAAHTPMGYDEREPGPVFYGKIENKVQERRRNDKWQAACSEWVVVKGAETEYKFSQMEYLQKLQSVRYGLCLPGYGYKCHREIECMAMGCVPVVSPYVDMDSYANPPVEGVHYIRVKEPEDVDTVLASVTKECWEAMSAAGRKWWKDNASCEGSFHLTEKLIASFFAASPEAVETASPEAASPEAAAADATQ